MTIAQKNTGLSIIFQPPEGRLANPSGLIYFEGEYHLFHQKMGTWAHAASENLLHWEHIPVVLEHDELGQALPGTAVIDWNDTTVFLTGKLVWWLYIQVKKTVNLKVLLTVGIIGERGTHIAVWETPDLFPLPIDGDEDNQK